MKLFSLVSEGERLIPAEVEIFLFPGLPQIHFLGLPDQIIKESLLRIKSALRNQQFEFPASRQVVVNIRPNHLRKSSRGLELAVAVGILCETGQIPGRLFDEKTLVYGELGLDGRVSEPDDLARSFTARKEETVLTGEGVAEAPFARERVRTLRDLPRAELVPASRREWEPARPDEGLSMLFSAAEAELLAVLALGSHHALLAGRGGCGKSSLLKALPSLMSAPTREDFLAGKVISRWRPVVRPHHSASAVSMIGGGVPPRRGEISRADGGLLVLDELLEFDPRVQEALREPMEEGEIRVSRGLRRETFTAAAQVVATTNLCPCGRWQPKVPRRCSYSRQRCFSDLQKLSGPFLDRFEILWFPPVARDKREVPGAAILERVEQARVRELALDDGPDKTEHLAEIFHLSWPESASERRKQAWRRVARSLSRLEGSPKIGREQALKAFEWTSRNFQLLLKE